MTPPRILTHVPWATTPRALVVWRVLLGLLMVAVGALAFDPNPPEQLDTGWDKLNHLLAFITLTVSAVLALQRQPHRLAMSGLGMLAFGVFIELVQTQIAGRTGEWLDLLADALGITLALLAALPTGPIERWLRLR